MKKINKKLLAGFLFLIGILMIVGIRNINNLNKNELISEAKVANKFEIIELKDGEKYDLVIEPVLKSINGKEHKMYAYNGSIPGPVLKVNKGSEVNINLVNKTDIETTLHSHGIRLENKFDGVPDITQDTIKPGESFSYKLKFPDVGIYWYHPHFREDMMQELGLYGNILVTSDDPSYWGEVDREEYLFLDDILIINNEIASFDPEIVDRTLMGRFGNTMLINGEDDYRLDVKQNERVRFYVSNSASVRVFNLSIPKMRMKLVGGDNGKNEREEWVDSVIISPSERFIVEAWFDKSGEYQISNVTPSKTYTLGKINVDSASVNTSYLPDLRTNQDFIDSLNPIRPLFSKVPDKSLNITLDFEGMMGGSGGHMMPDGTWMEGGMMMEENTDKIEWEDDMKMMNLMSTNENVKWKFVDDSNKKENMDIDWEFRRGEKVKLEIFNDPDSDHPMQHPIHIHGQRFLVTSTNGIANNNLVWKDTTLIQNGDTAELLVEMDNPGEWLIHCHIPEHMESKMMTSFEVI